MRKILAILTVMFVSSVFAFAAEDHDDHDNGPVQCGYAVVTPNGGAAGVVVFETFGERSFGADATTQAGVLPPDLTTDAVLFVDASGRLSKNLGVAIVNPNNASVDVTVTL